MEWIRTEERLPNVDEEVIAVCLWFGRGRNAIRELVFCYMDDGGEINHYDDLQGSFEEIVELWMPAKTFFDLFPLPEPPSLPEPPKDLNEHD